MDYYIAKYEELLSTGNTDVMNLFLIRNNYLPIILCVMYALVSTVIGPAVMKHRKPLELRMTMIVFNFFLVVVYLVCLATFLWNLQYTNYKFFCAEFGTLDEPITQKYLVSSHTLYILKYVEFLDTVFFILRKKFNQINTLHVIHHTFLPLLIWLTARTEKAPLQLIPLYLNAFVHIVMYSYYGLAAIGPSVQKHLWWKKYITQLQIIQFLAIMFLVTIFVPLSGCKLGIFTKITNYGFVPLILYLFYKFYQRSYQSKGKSKEATKNLTKQENGTKYLHAFSNDKTD